MDAVRWGLRLALFGMLYGAIVRGTNEYGAMVIVFLAVVLIVWKKEKK